VLEYSCYIKTKVPQYGTCFDENADIYIKLGKRMWF